MFPLSSLPLHKHGNHVNVQKSCLLVNQVQVPLILEFLDKFPAAEILLDYLYDLWMDADGGIGNEIFDTLEMELQ